MPRMCKATVKTYSNTNVYKKHVHKYNVPTTPYSAIRQACQQISDMSINIDLNNNLCCQRN